MATINKTDNWYRRLAAVGVASLGLGVGCGLGNRAAERVMPQSPRSAAAYAQSDNQTDATLARDTTGGVTPGNSTGARSTDELNTIQVARQVSPAVVTVMVPGGLGSGVIIDGANGIILTNNHVARQAQNGRVGIKLKNAKELIGEVVGVDPAVDIAVIRVNAKGLPTARLADSDKLEVGQTAIAIGNPLGLDQTLTHGVVSALNRKISPDDVEGFIQTDAAINPGNSGGPLLDSQGHVIGINTAVLRGNEAQSLGFAVPINVARDVARQILSNGTIKRAMLGVNPISITPQIGQQYELPVQEGVILDAVGRGTPAAQAGLRPGDVLTKINGEKLTGAGDLLRVLRSKNPGDKVTLGVLRPRGASEVTVQLGGR